MTDLDYIINASSYELNKLDDNKIPKWFQLIDKQMESMNSPYPLIKYIVLACIQIIMEKVDDMNYIDHTRNTSLSKHYDDLPKKCIKHLFAKMVQHDPKITLIKNKKNINLLDKLINDRHYNSINRTNLFIITLYYIKKTENKYIYNISILPYDIRKYLI